MPSIGETLREARMRQRLDIADVESRTKIRAKYLRALENEEFGMLPGPTFVKTFLRTDAEMLGLDPHVLVEEYRAHYEGEDELELQPLGPTSSAARERRRGPGLGPGSVALLALVAVLGVLLAIGLASDDGGDDDDAANTQATTAERTQAQTQEEPPPPRRVRVRVEPATLTYMCADRGPGTDVIFEQSTDAAQTFRGKRIRLLLGKRDVSVRMNGEPVEVPPGAEPIGFGFTPRGGRELPSGEGPCV
jgi:cytoskeleton protein RodZ